MEMFKRLKRLYELSKKDPESLKKLESLTEEEIAYIPEIGNGKAVFFDEGSIKEYKEFEKEESGLKPWYERLKNL